MSKENNTFGGFDILGDILTGSQDGSPSDSLVGDGDDPIMDPKDNLEDNNDDPIIDPSQQTGEGSDSDPEGGTEGKDDSDLKPDSEPDSNDSDDPIDLKEEEPLLVQYLQEELYKKFGWELPEGAELKDMDSLTDFIQSIVEESSQPVFASSELQQLNDYVENGGSLETYLNQRYQGNIDVEKLDMSKTANQSLVLRELFKRQGYSLDKIERKLQVYEDTGVLKEEAEDAHDLLKNIIKKEADTLLQEQEKIQRQAQENQQKYLNDVISTIDSLDNVNGMPFTSKEKKELKDYMFKTDKDGLTQVQKDYSKSPMPFIKGAYFAMKGDSLTAKMNNKATSQAAKQLKERLAAKGKRNKNVSLEGGSSSKNYDSLSSLGTALGGI